MEDPSACVDTAPHAVIPSTPESRGGSRSDTWAAASRRSATPTLRVGSPQRRRWLPRLALPVVSVLLTFSVGVGWWSGAMTLAGVAPWSDVQRTAAPTAVRPTEPDRLAELQGVLDSRAKALKGRDEAGWLRAIDPTATALTKRQKDVYQRLILLPFSSYAYTVVAAQPANGARVRADRTAWLATVRLVYRIGASQQEIWRTQHLTVVRRGTAWAVLSDDDFTTDRDLWDLTPISVVKSTRSLVIGARSQRSDLAAYAREADRGAARVDAALGRQWPRTTVLLAPADPTQMGKLLGWQHPEQLDQIAAVTADTVGQHSLTMSETEQQAPVNSWIYLNPEAFDEMGSLGKRVVITHELVHVATNSLRRTVPPLWVEEGYADYIAYRGTGLTRGTIAQEALDAVRDGDDLSHLPTSGDFDAATDTIGPAYGLAWLAMDFIARQKGDAAVTRFYRAATGISADGAVPAPSEVDSAQATADAAFVSALGTTTAAFTKRWRAYVEGLA